MILPSRDAGPVQGQNLWRGDSIRKAKLLGSSHRLSLVNQKLLGERPPTLPPQFRRAWDVIGAASVQFYSSWGTEFFQTSDFHSLWLWKYYSDRLTRQTVPIGEKYFIFLKAKTSRQGRLKSEARLPLLHNKANWPEIFSKSLKGVKSKNTSTKPMLIFM